MSSVIQIGQGVTALWGVENVPFLLLWPVAYTTACTTVQAVTQIQISIPSMQVGQKIEIFETQDVTKTVIFANSRWRTAAILKIALSPYLSRELSDFDQI